MDGMKVKKVMEAYLSLNDVERQTFFVLVTTLNELQAQQKAAPAYLYELLWQTPVFGGMLRTPHSIDLPLIFNIADGERWKPYTGGGADAVAVVVPPDISKQHIGNGVAEILHEVVRGIGGG